MKIEKNQGILLTTTTTLIVGLVVIVGIFIPLIDGLDDNVVSTYNNYTDRFMVVDEDDEELIINRNGETYTIAGNEFAGNLQLVVISESVIIKMTTTGMTVLDSDNNIAVQTNSIRFADGAYTYVSGGTTYTGTYDRILYPHPNGDYGCMYNLTTNNIYPFSANNDDDVFAISSASSNNYAFVATINAGTSNGFLFPAKEVSGGTLSTADVEITFNIASTESDDGLSHAYQSIKGSNDGVEFNVNVYAPVQYNVIDKNAEVTRSIISVLPIILIIGLLIIAAAAIMAVVANKNNGI